MEQASRDATDITPIDYDAFDEQVATIPAAGRDLFLVSAAHAVIHAISVLMPLIYPLLQIEYHLSYTQIGLIVAIPNIVGGLLQVIFGFDAAFWTMAGSYVLAGLTLLLIRRVKQEQAER